MKGFTVKAIITRCSSLRDKALAIGFHTSRELSEEDALEILRADGKEGWLLFRENEVKEDEIPKADADLEGKTPSQRLRAVLYVYWNQLPTIPTKLGFDTFYKNEMEKIITHYKNKLE